MKSLKLELDQGPVPLLARRSARAKRFILRLDQSLGQLVLTLPARASLEEGLAFAHRNRRWAESRLQNLPPHVSFSEGAKIPIRGIFHELCRLPKGALGSRCEAGRLLISGREEHLGRRTLEFLKREARADITKFITAKVPSLPPESPLPGKLSLGDTKSRWASCAASGALRFSWRLILAPPFVLDYVVGHELAHLLHKNHGPAFWRLSDHLTPQRPEATAWLKRFGATLYRYG